MITVESVSRDVIITGTESGEVMAQEEAVSEMSNVLVYMNGHDATRQPGTFQFCPLGIQFYVREPLQQYEVLECRVNITGGDSDASNNVICTGLVVNCCLDPETELYRVWVKFIDLPLQSCAHIQRLSRENQLLCSFCENFY